jgi:CBS domain-containing protein
MLVREIMSSPPVTISSASGVAHAADTLRSRGFTALPVIDDDGRLIGIVTEADLLDGRVEPDDRRDRPEQPRHLRRGDTVGEVMTSPVESLTPGADVADAVQIMLEERIRCLPVVDGRKIVGVITRRDLLRAIH